MPVDQVAKSLWTPEGQVPLRERDVIPITRNDIAILARLHEFSGKHPQVSLVCRRCDHSFQGMNNDSSTILSVSCQCTEFRFVR